ncbi:hypothetical protein BCR36DRAFT_263966, partial [Piromyces finnis]
GIVQFVQFLIEHGIKINEKKNNGDSALMNAAKYGHVKVVKYLNDNRHDINIANNNSLIIALYNNQYDIAKYIIE